MSLDPCTFHSITPSNYTTFSFPNPFPPPHHHHLLHTSLIHIAVLDSPSLPTTTPTPTTAAMLVPLNRETDWTFSTLSGHLQILLSLPHLSRLILISNFTNHANPISYKLASGDTKGDPIQIEEKLMPLMIDLAPRLDFSMNGGTPEIPFLRYEDKNSISYKLASSDSKGDSIEIEIEEALMPLMVALAPRLDFSMSGGVPEIPFLRYEDEVVQSDVLEICEGGIVGEMLVEDVMLKFDDGEEDFRRRLRFKRMPNLVQTQMRICRDDGEGKRFCVDDRVLVQPYLSPMVAGMMVIGGGLDGRVSQGLRPKALCLGVGGGALIRFLNRQMGFEVFGVEEDDIVLKVGRKYFGLESSESVHLFVTDGIRTIKKLAYRNSKSINEVSSGCCEENGSYLNSIDSEFDVIMVDMDSSDAKLGTCAPPMEFIRKSVLMGAKTILCEFGALIINVIPPTKSFYKKLITELMEVFAELYEIDVGNEENFVLIASVSVGAASGDCGNAFTNKLRGSISESYMDAIRKISKSVK